MRKPRCLSPAANSQYSRIAECQVPKSRCLNPAANSLYPRIAECQVPKPRCLNPADCVGSCLLFMTKRLCWPVALACDASKFFGASAHHTHTRNETTHMSSVPLSFFVILTYLRQHVTHGCLGGQEGTWEPWIHELNSWALINPCLITCFVKLLSNNV